MVTEKNIPIANLVKKNVRFGDMLLKENLINADQLHAAIYLHSQNTSKRHLTLSNTLVQLGYIAKEEMDRIMEECYERKGEIGELLTKESLISTEQIAKANEAHKKSGKTLGEELISSGYIAKGLFYNLLRRRIHPYELTNFLILKKLISKEQLQKAELVNRMGHRLGEIMVTENLITDDQLKRILSLQHNIPFKRFDTYRILEDKKKILNAIISKTLSNLYKVVPYSVEGEKVELAFSDIAFIEEIKNLERFKGYKFYACLVLDKDFKSLYQNLYNNFRTQADQEIKKPVSTEKKIFSNGDKIIGNYPSEFFRSYALFTKSYFNALKSAGFSEEQATKILGEETGIKLPGKLSEKKRTKNITELFRIILSDSQKEEGAINQLFQNYIKAKIFCGENSNGIRKEYFEELIIQNTQEIKKLKKCDSTKCSVIIKNGTAKILLIEN